MQVVPMNKLNSEEKEILKAFEKGTCRPCIVVRVTPYKW